MRGCIVLLSLTVAVLLGGQAVSAEELAWSPEQIEADWLRQDEVRNLPGLVRGDQSDIAWLLSLRSARAAALQIKPAEDAAGGCDGVKDGRFGFHTQDENQPWWQVDLGEPSRVERIVLYNRCDEMAPRNARIIVLVSDDGATWRQVYQHDGNVFYGHTGGPPLEVRLSEVTARHVRLQLPGKSYFHLDEVEVYDDRAKNIALDKPCTQSSASQWSVRHRKKPSGAPHYDTAAAIGRGRQLAGVLRQLGADVSEPSAILDAAARRLRELPKDAGDDVRRALYFEARWAVRQMALGNPLINFDKVLFVKRAPPVFPHMSDQYYGWWQRPGGGLWILEGIRGGRPRVRCLTEGWPDGAFLRPDLSYDGKRVLFAYARYYPELAHMKKVDKSQLPEDSFFHVFEMNLDGSGLRQLTRHKYDDIDARYLPDDEIVFLSTRKGTSVQCGKPGAMATLAGSLPDSYVRCGGGDTRPVAVYTLHVMDADGGNLRPISAFENFEWNPSVASDGRILYSRWDYIDRFNGPFMSLWSTNPDGTGSQLIYGNFTEKPQCVFEARALPGSQRLVFTAAAHHSNEGGSLVLLDRTKGTEGETPLERITPEVPFPETEGWPEHFYANPYPLSEQFYLVSWSDKPLPPHSQLSIDDPRNPKNAQGIYLYDVFGNLELLLRDPDISCMYPLPVRPRPLPPVLPQVTQWDGAQQGKVLLQDVYRGLAGVARGSVKRLRVVGVPPKVQPHINTPVLGVSIEDPGKFVLGSVPVEADGSAYFHVPSGIAIFFQALDEDGLALQTMRSLTYVQPQQTLSCIGCHEPRDAAPPVAAAPLAMMREPSKLAAGPSGSWPLRFDELVQPVLDKHCVGCHGAGSGTAEVASPDLTAKAAYDGLLAYADGELKRLAVEKDRSIPGDCVARQSKLFALLRQGHEGVELSRDDFDRLATWMDVYAHRQGSFSPEQEEELRRLRQVISHLLAGP
jgi:hypothetical protein